MCSKLLSQFLMGMYKKSNAFILASCLLWMLLSPQTIFAVTPSTPRGPYYMCDLQQGVAYINWYNASGATSYEFSFDSKTPSWNNNCSSPNKGDACISTTETNVTVPIIPLEQNDWWVRAVNRDGYSPALDGQSFSCEIPLPRRFYYECTNNNSEVVLSWQTLGSAERYEVRLDANPETWNGSCDSPNAGDHCGSTTTTSITLPIEQGILYRSWVHSVQSGVWTMPGTEGPQVQCGYLPTATPRPTNTPTPTNIPLPTAAPTSTPEPTIVVPTEILSPTVVETPTPTPTPTNRVPTLDPRECPRHPEGDADCDNDLDEDDYACWKSEFVYSEMGADCVRTADFDSADGVTLLDYAIWQIHYVVEVLL